MKIDATNYTAKELNEQVKQADGEVELVNVLGERFIACGLSNKKVTVYGTPGNAFCAYLDGATVEVFGNGQDAVGDTMNDGKVVIRGSVGDALGYAMRGGRIYVKGDAGYRLGVHMKEYKDKKPVIIIGGHGGSFLGEYMAGGLVAVLNLDNAPYAVGNFTGVGMHGGKIFIRGKLDAVLPPQVKCEKATTGDLNQISGYLKEYCEEFELDYETIAKEEFFVLTPNSANPYKRLYTSN